jgi:hypothetical protein
MRCEECQLLIERYFDGELGGADADVVTGHLAACGSCAQTYQTLEREQEFYLRHESEIKASPNFWENVFAKAPEKTFALSVRPSPSLRDRLARAISDFCALRLSPLSTVVIALIAIGLTAGVMKYRYSRESIIRDEPVSQRFEGNSTSSASPDGGTPNIQEGAETHGGRGIARDLSAPPANSNRAGNDRASAVARTENARARQRPAAIRRRQGPEELVREAEQKYIAAIALLSRDANRRRSQLDAETQTQFDQTLAAIDRAIVSTRRVAHGRPEDPVAVQYMLTAYVKKVDLLRQIVGEE